MRPVLVLLIFAGGCTPQGRAPPGKPTPRPPALPLATSGSLALTFAAAPSPAPVDTSQSGGWTETSPWTFPLAGQHGFLISTAFTLLCSGADSLAGAPDGTLAPTRCDRILAAGTTDLPDPATLDAPEWRRNYYGAFSAHALDPSTPDSPLLLFAHGENKNENLGGILYQNTINPGATDYSGYDATGEYVDAWDAYNAFIGSVILNNPTRLATDGPAVQDNGPVVWPSAGYLDAAGTKTSEGVRHPSSLIYDGNVYLFYLDTSYAGDPERTPGIKVARAPLAGAGAPGSFHAFWNGDFTEPALPDGYSAADNHASLATPGPRATSILGPDSADDVRFSVAQVSPSPTEGPLFLGVEEHFDDLNGWWVALRLSTDLVGWTLPYAIPGIAAPTWDDGTMNYPILMDRDGWTNTTVSLDAFYVVGTSASQTNVLPLSITVAPAP